jgi:Zn/Cd-binding protein ZinT
VNAAGIESAMHDAVRKAVEVILAAAPADADDERARDVMGAVFALVGLSLRAVPRRTMRSVDGKWEVVYGLLRDGELIADSSVRDSTPMRCVAMCARLLTAPHEG